MVRLLSVLAALPLATAYPWAMNLNAHILARQDQRRPPLFESGRPNTGRPPGEFNAEGQYVDVTEGSGHEYQRPGPTDLRGECPGLNAAANHGFLPRNGIATITDTANGLEAAYNMDPVLGVALAILSIALSGDYLTQTWTIGGDMPNSAPGLLGQPHGIVGTHNEYEGDASPVSNDAYLAGGYVNEFRDFAWTRMWEAAADGLTLDKIAAQNDFVVDWSINNNPYYFSGPLSGVIVTPGAHVFIINFMSNHSAENPGGELTQEVLQSFFGVTGDPVGGWTFDPPTQRIPENWYKRPATNKYDAEQTVLDGQINNLMYPGVVRLGGNTGQVNTFTGVDLEHFTGGLFNAESLAQGNNAWCFAMQAAAAGKLDQLNGAGIVAKRDEGVLAFMAEGLAPFMAGLGCGDLMDGAAKFDMSELKKFPGYNYKAQGQQ